MPADEHWQGRREKDIEGEIGQNEKELKIGEIPAARTAEGSQRTFWSQLQ